MRWILLPVILALLIVVFLLSQKIKRYLLMKIVQSQILQQFAYSEDVVIQVSNLGYAFVIIPVLLMAFSLFMGQPYTYSLTVSVVVYISSFMLL